MNLVLPILPMNPHTISIRGSPLSLFSSDMSEFNPGDQMARINTKQCFCNLAGGIYILGGNNICY